MNHRTLFLKVTTGILCVNNTVYTIKLVGSAVCMHDHYNQPYLKEYLTNMRQCVLCLGTDPLSMGPQKALETVGNKLQEQYERWQPRVRGYLHVCVQLYMCLHSHIQFVLGCTKIHTGDMHVTPELYVATAGVAFFFSTGN